MLNVVKRKLGCEYFEFRYIETISGSFFYLKSDVASNGGVVTKDIYYLLCLCRSFVKPTLFILATICHFNGNVIESLSYFWKEKKIFFMYDTLYVKIFLEMTNYSFS